MKKRLISVLVALVLIVLSAVPAMAAEEAFRTATVEVTEYISFTIDDHGTAGINFGSISAGTDNSSEAAQNGIGAVNLLVGSETNVDCNLQIKGSDDFTDGGTNTLLLNNAKWSTTDNVSDSTPMSASYGTVDTSTAGVSANVSVWHWLTIPSDQYAAIYTTTFYYQAIATP